MISQFVLTFFQESVQGLEINQIQDVGVRDFILLSAEAIRLHAFVLFAVSLRDG